MADRAAVRATHWPESDIHFPKCTSLINSRIQRTAIDLWPTMAEHNPTATKSLKWNLSLFRNKQERKALDKIPQPQQREVLRLRLRVLEPKIFEGAHKCLQCGQVPRNEVTHYLTDCPSHHARCQLLLKHIYPPDRVQENNDLALSIINRQTTRNYKDITRMLQIFPMS